MREDGDYKKQDRWNAEDQNSEIGRGKSIAAVVKESIARAAMAAMADVHQGNAIFDEYLLFTVTEQKKEKMREVLKAMQQTLMDLGIRTQRRGVGELHNTGKEGDRRVWRVKRTRKQRPRPGSSTSTDTTTAEEEQPQSR